MDAASGFSVEEDDEFNKGVRVVDVPGMGSGLFATRAFSQGDVVCRDKPIMCYDIRSDYDAMAARVRKFLAPHRSVSQGGRWGQNCPGALPYAFQWTLFLAQLSAEPDEKLAQVEGQFYSPSIGDGVAGVQISRTFEEASKFADFLLELMASSFTALMV